MQEDLGIPINWTQSNTAVSRAFRSIGDYPRPGWKEDLAYLLEEGIKVTLVYGDRDYACNVSSPCSGSLHPLSRLPSNMQAHFALMLTLWLITQLNTSIQWFPPRSLCLSEPYADHVASGTVESCSLSQFPTPMHRRLRRRAMHPSR